MANKMLIDAAHPEETRVVVKGNRVEEFDYESASKKQLRGNIYLAKVTRVEPSLQAAFVDYGGNRHGFLAFTEIHPDYYQIPVADRQALLEEEAAEQSRASAEEAAEDDAASSGGRRRGRRRRGRGRGDSRRDERKQETAADDDTSSLNALPIATFELDDDDEVDTTPRDERDDDDGSDIQLEASDLVHEVSEPAEAPAEEDDAEAAASNDGPQSEDASDDDVVEARKPESSDDDADAEDHADDDSDHSEDSDDDADDDESDDDDDSDDDDPDDDERGDRRKSAKDRVESVGSEDALEELPERARRRRGRPYKIQEVIRRRQIILVQVVKEERGNKGAALTTYLSLAGRYTVLMPNTARGGGISRKITQPTDRKRLREIAGELEVPEGMGLIIRTAGAQRTKTEIKRDYDYLLRLWETVRDLTLGSTAPALVYEEGSLIKRSIRDLYNKDIDEVLVAGDDAYREAKDFMRMLMPSHAKNVKPYKEPEPIFIRYQVERQLAAMFSPQVTLRSGGYIVINQTEALVSVDVNSGKATREHNIEDTALKTNMEAAEEIARQLRLRDLAGLIVIDFIDMDERRNNRQVERRLKDALKNDRARIQVGRISAFGLLEMSRQRLRTGVLEGSTNACAMCQGTGIVRSVESVALDILRSIEDRLITDGVVPLSATTAVDVALYILNQKRAHLKDIEARYEVPITVEADKDLHIPQFVIERSTEGSLASGDSAVVQMDWAHHREEASQAEDGDGESGKRRSRRRRGRGRGRGEGDSDTESQTAEASSSDEEAAAGGSDNEAADGDSEQQPRKSRRRGRRGGRRGRGRGQRNASDQSPDQQDAQSDDAVASSDTGSADSETSDTTSEPVSMHNAETQDNRDRADTPADNAPSEDTPVREVSVSEYVAETTAEEQDDDDAEQSSEPASRSPEPALSIASSRDEPVEPDPKPEIRIESEGKEPERQRKGWWSRG
ncbi:Rne/Rng family ribonuclease [Methyloceanibacter caenitepidi]|uniref:Ribonuclease E n=1 Tax=Methyloceanibacter caenitepidi TaxID=1384459 RepID=A0A0A8K311_9HYPH|nr:ribonuclease E/G [Methyloceanibacter caenitepidi]BAQ17196.1 cytoplasmic axial filament protein CafA and ribonuclease G [Methyloceanibacter caenitepidi]